MSRKAILAALLLCLLGTSAVPSLFADPFAPTPQIRLKSASFDPGQGEPTLPVKLRAPDGVTGPQAYLVQFAGAVDETKKAALTQMGVQLYGYIPDNAFLARMDAATAEKARALATVRWVGVYHPAYRLAPDLLDPALKGKAGDSQEIMVQLFPHAEQAAVISLITSAGGRIVAQSENALGSYLRVLLPATELIGLAAHDGVVWMESYFEPRLLNDVGGGTIMRTNEVRQIQGLFGAGQLIGVADSGLDTGAVDSIHPDVHGRVLGAYCLGRPQPCDWSDPNGHGTHVSGSVLGSGIASGANPSAHQYADSQAGVAPEARLIFQSIMASNGSLAGIPNDRGDLMRQAYQGGARIHTNSWGGGTGDQDNPFGGYVLPSQQVDLAAWEMKDMLILYAAGNQGNDANLNGVIDPDSILQPGTAKNALTVGASENERPNISLTWGAFFENSVDPLASDPIADSRNGMAAFSSRGPTDDGRIKPEVVAPGTRIASMRSRHPEANPGNNAINEYYFYSDGTSMATPLAAGAGAIVREWLTRVRSISTPSAALVKAMLLNGTADMAPGQYGAGATQEIPTVRPNLVTGWGRVDLVESLIPPEPRQIWFQDHTTGLATGETAQYNLVVGGGLVQQQPQPAAPALASRPAKPAGTTQLIEDPGFEGATLDAWGTFGNAQRDTTQVHSGSASVHLGNSDEASDAVYQLITIPDDALEITMSIWYRVSSEETAADSDIFCYGLVEELLPQPIPVVGSCLDVSALTQNVWTEATYTLTAEEVTAVAGRSLAFGVGLQTDFSLVSRAWVDDVAFMVTTPGGEPTPTPTVSVPTPTPGGPTPTPGPTTGGPVRVMLTWTDYPGQALAAKSLVNDLDLEVVAPDGTRYVGNQGLYSPGHPCRGANGSDHCNNHEGVIIPEGLNGTYQVIVRGVEVPQGGRQPFAVVASGDNMTVPTGNHRVYLPLLRR